MRAIEARVSGKAKQQGPYRELRLDTNSHGLITISQAHKEVHDGESYWFNYGTTLANGEVAQLAFTTPASPTEVHVIAFVSGSADGVFTLIEGATSYSGGVAGAIYNHKRFSLTTSQVTVPKYGMTGATVITVVGGTTIMTETFAQGNGVRWERKEGTELILKPSTKYIYQVTNGVSSNTVSIKLDWYEHEPLD